jgi:hypothetical protein
MDGTFDDMRRALLQFGREAVGVEPSDNVLVAYAAREGSQS